MGNIFAELKRRHIYRVAAAYAVVAWVSWSVLTSFIAECLVRVSALGAPRPQLRALMPLFFE